MAPADHRQTPEGEAIALLVRIRADREAARDDLRRALSAADPQRLVDLLARQRLLAIAAARAQELAPDAVPDALHATARAVHRAMAIRSLLLDATAADVGRRLGAAGIRAVPLKGPALSTELYGDPGLRPSSDVDVLVAPRDLVLAVDALVAAGYPAPTGAWRTQRPALHHVLKEEAGRRPPIELHWRVHWYEEAFAADVVDRATPGPDGRLVATPVDELAILLLVWARDGLTGYRGAVDAATAWEVHRDALGSMALTPIARAHPRLAAALTAAATALERLTGVPRTALLPEAGPASRRARAAARMAAPYVLEGDERDGVVAAVDAALTPVQGVPDYLRRHLVPGDDELADLYDVAPGARGQLLLRRLQHGQGAARGLLRHAGGHGWRSALAGRG